MLMSTVFKYKTTDQIQFKKYKDAWSTDRVDLDNREYKYLKLDKNIKILAIRCID